MMCRVAYLNTLYSVCIVYVKIDSQVVVET